MNLNLEVNVWPDKRRNIYNGTFQTAKSNDVDQYFTTPLQHVGCCRAFPSDPTDLNMYILVQAIWHYPIHSRELSKIIGRYG